MAYSELGDLLTGDMLVSQRINKQKFIDDAADEMDAKLGWTYVVPIPQNIPRHQLLLLKGINNKLASGRLILTLDIAGEQTTLHAYGLRLIREATDELLLLANGTLILDAVLNDPATTDAGARTPGTTNHDEESLLLGFENTVLRGEKWYSRPGVVT